MIQRLYRDQERARQLGAGRDLGHDTAQGRAIRPRHGRLYACDTAGCVRHDTAPLGVRARGLGVLGRAG